MIQHSELSVSDFKGRYMALFEPGVESFLITNQKGKSTPKNPYMMRITRNIIDLRTGAKDHYNTQVYDFDTGVVTYNGSPLKGQARLKFFEVLKKISSQVDRNEAVVFQEKK